jgi:hypothetical protein
LRLDWTLFHLGWEFWEFLMLDWALDPNWEFLDARLGAL